MARLSASPTATRWLVVSLAIGAGIVGAFQIGKASIALPAIRADLGLGLAAAGWVLSMFNLIGVFAGLVLGAVIGRWGDRRAVLVGLATIAAASLAGAAAPNLAVLLVTRFFEGAGFLMVIVGVPSLIVRFTRPDDLKLALGAWGAYVPIGQSIMIVVAPALLSLLFGWRGLWVANAALLAGFALILAWATRSLPAAPPRPTQLLVDLRATLAARGPLLLAVNFGCYSSQYLAVMGFLPTVLIEREGLAPGLAGLLAAVAVALNGVGSFASGVLQQRGVPRWALVVAGSLVMGVSALAIFTAGLPPIPSYALYLVFSGVGGVVPGSLLSAVPRHAPAPHLIATTNGLIVQCSNLGQVIGPPAVGAIAATIGWGWSPLVVSTAAAAAAALGLVLRRRDAEREKAHSGPHVLRQAQDEG